MSDTPSLKDVAVAAATEKARHDAEQKRIETDQRRLVNEQQNREVTRRILGVLPDEVIASAGYSESGYVRVEDMWFMVAPAGHFKNYLSGEASKVVALGPVVRCIADPTTFHHVDLSLYGDKVITSLVRLGELLSRLPVEEWVKHAFGSMHCGCRD